MTANTVVLLTIVLGTVVHTLCDLFAYARAKKNDSARLSSPSSSSFRTDP